MKNRHDTRSQRVHDEEQDQQGPGIGRRDFMKGFAAAAGVAGVAGPASVWAKGPPGWTPPGQGSLAGPLQAPPTITAAPGSEGFWKQVRKAFALPPDYIHMNTGTTGSLPVFALNNLGVYNRYKSEDPRDWQANLNADFPGLFSGPSAVNDRQAQVAAAYHADPSEIVLSYDTTDGCNLIFAGTPWKPGDRIVTTSFEHPALTGPIAWAQQVRGVEVVTIDMGLITPFTAGLTVQDVLALFEPELAKPLPSSDNKQYLAFSEIFYKNGLRLPVEELCALARSYGAYSIVDTAHGFGMLPIDLHGYGADFVAGAGHKWLSGGPGTGILYVRNTGSDLPPFDLGNLFLYGFLNPQDIADRTYDPSRWMQPRGEYNRPALFAMTDSLSLFQQVGIHAIYERGVDLGNRLKEQIAYRWPGALWVEARPPYDPFATALTSFNPFVGRESSDPAVYAAIRQAIVDVVEALAAEDPKIYIRFVTWKSQKDLPDDDRIGFRVSTHGVYNSFGDVDYVFDRLVHHIENQGLATL